MIGASLAEGTTDRRETGFNTIDQGDWFAAMDLDWTTQFDGLEGNCRILMWFSDVDPRDGDGIALSFDHEIAPGVVSFLRLGYAQDDAADFDRFVSAGLGIASPLGRQDDLVGIGVAWARPNDARFHEETLLEVFYRIQFTVGVQVTPDIQVILNPAQNTQDDTVAVFGTRLQANF